MPLSFFDGLPEGGARAIEASGMRFDFGIVATIVGLIGNFRDEGIDFDRSFDFHDVLVGAEEGGAFAGPANPKRVVTGLAQYLSCLNF